MVTGKTRLIDDATDPTHHGSGSRSVLLRLGQWAALVLTLFFCLVSPSSGQNLPSGFAESLYVGGLPTAITSMAFAPDGRLFICEKGGRVRVAKNGVILSAPFVTVEVDTYDERGLEGITFDPDFASNGYVYLYYTAKTPTVHNRVSRFTAQGDVAVAGSEFILLDLEDLRTSGSLYGAHNGGALHFGADGKLYVAVGENNEPTLAQSLSSLKGKMLRINPDGTIPTDNPFYTSTTGNNRAIWALGFRNPFTFDVQPGTGRIFINDVGAADWEEVNDGIPGANYGWPLAEGPSTDPSLTSPFFAYAHGWSDTEGCAITGGAFYNPLAAATAPFPAAYTGQYFYMDYCSGWIRLLNTTDATTQPFATEMAGYPVYLVVGPEGSLYYMSQAAGAVYKIAYTGLQHPQIGQHPFNQTVSEGKTATFVVRVSGDAPISYQWRKDGAEIPGATEKSYTTPPVTSADNLAKYSCVATNAYGTATSNAATLTVTPNQPPAPSITAPVEGTLYTAGDTITYSGTATDPEDGTLPASAYTWEVRFQHDTHYHPYIPPTSGSTGGTFTIPTTGETASNVWYRILLTATDSQGVTTTVYRDVHPRTANITLSSNVPGLQVTLDGSPQTTPYSFVGVAGASRTLGVVTPQTLNGVTYEFDSWSDGGAETHTITTPSTDTTYTANFRPKAVGTISASPNPIVVCDGTGLGVTKITWSSQNTTAVEVRLGSPSGARFAYSGPGTWSWTTGKWVSDGTKFYLQDVSGGKPLTSANTLAVVTVGVTSSGCPATGTIGASPNPIQVCDGSGLGATKITWSSQNTTAVEVRVGSPSGARFAYSGPGTWSWTTGKWVSDGTKFYLQDVSGGKLLTAENTLAVVTVGVTNNGCPATGTISANPNPIVVCDGSGLGATKITWSSQNTTAVEVRVGSPSGALFASSGPGTWSWDTGKWVNDGGTFYLQDVSGGKPLTSENTLATVRVGVTSTGCPAQ